MSDTSLERRRSDRVPIALSVEVRDGRGFSIHASRDLSEGGVYFDRAIPHAVGTRVQLSFTLPGDGQALRCEGEVVNVPDARSYGMGVRFVGLAAEDRARLLSFLRTSSKGSP
jgi:uncharacterized protein (TIGR02266 family)